MIRVIAIVIALFPSLAFAGGPVRIGCNSCGVAVAERLIQLQTTFAQPIGFVNNQVAFAQPIGVPAYQASYAVPVAVPLGQYPQAYYGGTVSTTYKQSADQTQWEKMQRLEAKIDLVLSDLVAQGRVSGAILASVKQPTINQMCLPCHATADPNAGKGFALTDISALTADQHKKILRRVMTKDESLQMPPPSSVQRKTWDADKAGSLLDELANSPSKSTDATPANVGKAQP